MGIYQLLILGIIFYAPWEPIGPEGGDFRLVLQSTQDASDLYGYSFGFPSSLLKSTDEGSTWSLISNVWVGTVPADMVMTASGDFVIFGNAETHNSTNGGITWTTNPCPDVIFTDGIAHPTDGTRVFATGFTYTGSTTNMIFLSSNDGGFNWDTTALVDSSGNSEGLSIDVCSSNPDRIIVGGGNETTAYIPYLFISTDGGISFSEVTPNEAVYHFSGVAFHPLHPDTVLAGNLLRMFRSVDGGISWTDVASLTETGDITFSEVDCSLVLCTGEDRIYRSSDTGQSWSTVSSGLSGDGIRCVVPDVDNGSMVFTGSSDGFFRSSDSGQSWSAQNSGILLGYAGALDCCDGWIYAELWDRGVFKAEVNSFPTWQEAGTIPGYNSLCDIEALNMDTVLAFQEYSTGPIQIWRSVNGGSSWSTVDSYYTYGRQIVNQHGNTVWSCGQKYEEPDYLDVVSVSYDAGSGWTRHILSSSSSFSYIATVAVDPDDENRVFCMANRPPAHILYWTEDGGNTWFHLIPAGLSNHVYDIEISPSNGDLIAAAAWDGLYSSIDAGATWTKVTTEIGTINELMSSSLLSGLLIASRYDGVWLWSNWQGTPYKLGSNPGIANVQRLAESEEYIYAGTFGRSIWQAYFGQGIGEEHPAVPGQIRVNPNPVSSSAILTFVLSSRQQVSLEIYDITGRRVMVAADGMMCQGSNNITIDTASLSTGMYFARLTMEGDSATTRMIVIK